MSVSMLEVIRDYNRSEQLAISCHYISTAMIDGDIWRLAECHRKRNSPAGAGPSSNAAGLRLSRLRAR
jgi:hypothetical protein